MGNCCPNCFIILGGFILFMAALLTFGFNFIVKTAVPIAMNFLPLNETLQLWIEIPLALVIKAVLTHANTSSEISNRTLALAQLGFKIEMATWTDESPVIPILFIEEEGRIETLMRYLLVLSDGPLNYAQYYCWTLAAFSFLIGIVGGALWFKNRNS